MARRLPGQWGGLGGRPGHRPERLFLPVLHGRLWQGPNGLLVSFQQGQVSASFSGFNGGPNGSYQMSSEHPDGIYELVGSHITGDTVDYTVTVHDASHIALVVQNTSRLAPKQLTLVRQ